MKVGTIIKEARKAKGLNQNGLGKGICTQATISNLESNRSLPNVKTLKLIADRLSIDIKVLIDYLPDKNERNEIFQLAKVSLRKKDYKNVEKVLSKNIKLNELSSREMKEYHYYLGMVDLLAKNNFQDAMYHFNLGLQETDKNRTDIIDTVTLNGIGVAYFMEKEIEKARVYFEKSLIQLEEMRSIDDKFLDLTECIKVYYNIAKYYAHMNEYSKANNLLSKVIDLQKKIGRLPELEMLYFEKGVNFAGANELKKAKKMFFVALGLCEINYNESLIAQILNEAKELGIESMVYEK